LITLEYMREYRTYLSIAVSCGLRESDIYKAIRFVGDTLLSKHSDIMLSGKAA
jgi:hypothetical protein